MAEERRIRKELESLQGQVIRQERLAAVGQLVSGVAHEINNPLQSISGFAELLRLQRSLPESAQSDLTIILRESARANAIIRNLALFARQQPGPAAPIRLGEVIAAVAELRQRRLESEQIELRIDDASTQHGAGGADRAAAGRPELRRQRGAGDPVERSNPGARDDPDLRSRRHGSCSRSRTPGLA